MKTIYGLVGGLVTGFVAAVLATPRSGKETRSNLGEFTNDKWYDLRMAYQKLALKIGIGSRKKIADLTKEKKNEIEKNQKKTVVDPNARGEKESLEKVHEKSAATKAVDGPTAKSHLRKVPVNPK